MELKTRGSPIFPERYRLDRLEVRLLEVEAVARSSNGRHSPHTFANHLHAFHLRERHWLLTEDVYACPGCAQSVVGVLVVRQRDVDRVDLAAGQERVVAGVAREYARAVLAAELPELGPGRR